MPVVEDLDGNPRAAGQGKGGASETGIIGLEGHFDDDQKPVVHAAFPDEIGGLSFTDGLMAPLSPTMRFVSVMSPCRSVLSWWNTVHSKNMRIYYSPFEIGCQARLCSAIDSLCPPVVYFLPRLCVVYPICL